MEVGEEGDDIPIAYTSHHQNDFCIKMGSDESHFNVSAGSDGQSHKTASTNHNLSKEGVVFQTDDIYIYISGLK